MLTNTLTAILPTMILTPKDRLTWLVPSRTPITLDDRYDGWHVLNTVQLVRHHAEMHYAYCKAIDSITTEYFTIADDDPLPTLPKAWPDVGIIYGDLHVNYRGHHDIHRTGGWDIRAHLSNELWIHRAICRTEDAQAILRPVKDRALYTEQWLYLHLAKDHGWHYDPDYVAVWYKRARGLQHLSGQVRHDTRKALQALYHTS